MKLARRHDALCRADVMAGNARSGRPVAELRPLGRRGLDPQTLLTRWQLLPRVDPEAFRADIDSVIDPAL